MMSKLRILLIEDDTVDRIAIINELQKLGKHIQIDEASDAKTARQMLTEKCYGCVLLDYGLPQKNGLQFIKEMQSTNMNTVPIIVLTRRDDENLGIKMVHEGAQDYLIKNQVDGKQILRSIHYAMERFKLLREIAEAKQREQKEIETAITNQNKMRGWQDSSITAQMIGMGPLRKRFPHIFVDLLKEYESLLDSYLEAITFNQPPPRQQISSFAYTIGDYSGGPRDVVDIHIKTVESKCIDKNQNRVRVYTIEGRLLILEVMGNLVDYYRLWSSKSKT